MKKKDIILRVWGGVGNQLFIYAFAKVLSLITDCKVTLDIRTDLLMMDIKEFID